ncbi:DUF6484 domain-containing protein [Amaricoccus solimangrovi]|nr:DUF6484 domain-containing protein [Amaricoccus solimangrovi]
MIGRLVTLDDGRPLVAFGGPPVSARSLTPLDLSLVGAEVALMFEEGDPSRPLILGPLLEPAGPVVLRDGERVRVTASERIELRVGKASLIMEKDGHITIRGTYLVSQASAANRVRGGSVHLN